jgi:AcrR family transcriptional regulator
MTDAPASVRPPQQERSRASFERVLEAAQALIEDDGYQGFTVAEVSRRARVSIGSIYARVSSKDALFHAVHERVMAEIATADTGLAAPERWASASTSDLIRGAVRAIAAQFAGHARFLRVAMHRGAIDDHVAAVGSAASSREAELFAALLLTRRAEIVHADPELAVDVAYRMAYCTLARQVMYGPTFESQHRVGWDALVDELGDACVRYLTGPAAPPRIKPER